MFSGFCIAQPISNLVSGQKKLDFTVELARQTPLHGIAKFEAYSERYIAEGDSLLAATSLAHQAYWQAVVSKDLEAVKTLEQARQLLPHHAHWYSAAMVALGETLLATKQRRLTDAKQAIDLLDSITVGIPDTFWLIKRTEARSILEVIRGEHAEALQRLYEVQPIALAYNDSTVLNSMYSNLAYVHEVRNDWEAYWETENRAYAYSDKKHVYPRFNWHHAVTARHLVKGEVELALKTIDKAIKFADSLGLFETKNIFIARRGDVLRAEKKYEDAIKYYREAETAKRSQGRDPSELMYMIAICYRGLDRYDLAGPQLEAAFAEAKSRNHMMRAQFIAHATYQTYLWREKYKQALSWHERHVHIRDSIRSQKQLADEKIILAKLETRDKEMALQAASLKTVKAQSRVRLMCTLLLLFIGLTAFGYYAYQKRQNRRITDLTRKQLRAEQRGNQLSLAVDKKNAQLNTQALTLTQKNTLLSTLYFDLEKTKDFRISREAQLKTLAKLKRSISSDLTETQEWDVFMASVEEMRSAFFTELTRRHPSLTSNEKRLISLLRLNMSSKEIARTLNISEGGVKKARYRLRKKLGLTAGLRIDHYLEEVAHSSR